MTFFNTPWRRLSLSALPLIALAGIQPAMAQSPEGKNAGQDRDTVTVAAGVAYGPSYQGSDDYRALPGFQLRGKVSNHHFFMRGLQLYVDALPEPDTDGLNFSIGPVAGVRLDRVNGIRDAQVKALGKKNVAVELGGFAAVSKRGVLLGDYDSLALRVTYVTDVANAHKSYVVTPAVEYAVPLSKRTLVALSVSADYVGDGFARYYRNIDADGAAASGLAPYSAKGGFSTVNAGLLATRALGDDLRQGWSVFGIANYGRQLGDFKDSPIVSDAGSANQWFGAVGVGYTF